MLKFEMKKILLFLGLPLIAMFTLTNCGKDDDDQPSVQEDPKTQSFTISGSVAGFDYVDLGLASGLKWATYNVGATKPTEYGDFFAWGEVKPKREYTWATYKWCTMKSYGSDYDQFTKYNTTSYSKYVDKKTVLDEEDDAASVNWGNAWRTPSISEMKELLAACSWTWFDDFENTGVAGNLGTSKKNGNTIFFPAAGLRSEANHNGGGSYGVYWTLSLHDLKDDKAWFMVAENNDHYIYGLRYHGFSVRAVTEK